MKTVALDLDIIELGQRHRAVSDADVQRLAKSISDIGLKHPITIRIADNVNIDGKPCDGVPILVAGAHRLAAAKLLGWEKIDCIEIEGDEIAAELWEIAENLHRCDLTKEQRDSQIRRYAELIEARSAIVCQNEKQSPRPVGRPKAIVTEVAEATGLSTQTVRRALNPAPPEPKSALPDHDVITVQFNALVNAWNRAGSEARAMFQEHIDVPVFDHGKVAWGYQ